LAARVVPDDIDIPALTARLTRLVGEDVHG